VDVGAKAGPWFCREDEGRGSCSPTTAYSGQTEGGPIPQRDSLAGERLWFRWSGGNQTCRGGFLLWSFERGTFKVKKVRREKGTKWR